MAVTHTDTNIEQIRINKFASESDYQAAVNNGDVAATDINLIEGDENIADLGDVTLTNLSDGQVLKYNSTSGKWVNVNPTSNVDTVVFTNENDTISADKSIVDIILGIKNGKTYLGIFPDSSDVGAAIFMFAGTDADLVNPNYTDAKVWFETIDEGYGISTLEGIIGSESDLWTVAYNELLQVGISNPTDGQVLAYDSTNGVWVNQSLGDKVLTANSRIWNLDQGWYRVAPSVQLLYNGANGSDNFSTSYGGYLQIVSQGTTSKDWIFYYTVHDSVTGRAKPYINSGTTTSSSGSYVTIDNLYDIPNGTNTEIPSLKYRDVVSLTSSALNTQYYTPNTVACGYITDTSTGKPEGLTLSKNTYCVLDVKNAYSQSGKASQNYFYIRQDLYIPELNKHYYRLVKFYNNAVSFNTTITGADTNGWVEVIETAELPDITGKANKVLKVNSSATGVEWADESGGGSGGTDEKLALSAVADPGPSSDTYDLIVTNNNDSTITSAKTRQYLDEVRLDLFGDSTGSVEFIVGGGSLGFTGYGRFTDGTNWLGISPNAIIFEDGTYVLNIYRPQLTGWRDLYFPDKNGILAVTSDFTGINDGTNWTSLTINGVTKSIPSGGGGGTASTLAELSDTAISSPSNNQILQYNGTLSKWVNSTLDLSGYQPLDADLTAIAELTGTSGLLKKTAANTWSLDTSSYLTSHQSIKTLKTNNSSAQSTSAGEAINGSGTINLHKISKTGNYYDLNNLPTIPSSYNDLNDIPIKYVSYNDLINGYGIDIETIVTEIKYNNCIYICLFEDTDGIIPLYASDAYSEYSQATGDLIGAKVTFYGLGGYSIGVPYVYIVTGEYTDSDSWTTDQIQIPDQNSVISWVDSAGYTKNNGTVTSVRVQAGTGLSSSTSTAQSATLNTTISIASGYKLPTTTEWNNKISNVQSDWNATSGLAQILNKPTIPTVNDSTITITQGGVTKGSFTLNQTSNQTIELDTGGGGGSTVYLDFSLSDLGPWSGNQTISFITTTKREYQKITATGDLNLTISSYNNYENYILVHNTSTSSIDVTIAGVGSLASSAIITPKDGITISAGKYIELSVYANSSMAVITASGELE